MGVLKPVNAVCHLPLSSEGTVPISIVPSSSWCWDRTGQARILVRLLRRPGRLT